MLGFTRQEQQIILFLVVSLLIGSFLKVYNRIQQKVKVAAVEPGQIEAFKTYADSLEQVANEAIEAPNLPGTESDEIAVVDAISSSANSDRPTETESTLLLDLNTASKEELQSLPRVGPVLAQRIVDYRAQIGAFGEIEELKKVKGIGDKTFEKIKPYVSLKNK